MHSLLDPQVHIGFEQLKLIDFWYNKIAPGEMGRDGRQEGWCA
jgi:hypothetical protein